MKWPFSKWDLIILSSFALGIGVHIYTLPAYKNCQAPIQIFVLINLIAVTILYLIVTLLIAPDLPNSLSRCFNFLINFIISPIVICFPIASGFCYFINLENSPDYLTTHEPIWIVCITIGSLGICGFGVAKTHCLEIKKWWRINQFRRRIRDLYRPEANEDFTTAAKALLSETEDIKNQVGLVPEEIESLERRNFSRSFANLLRGNRLARCSICFEEFRIGDEIICLPKCKETFHSVCISEWLTKTSLCPICSEDVRNNLYGVGHNERQAQNHDDRVPEDLENPIN